MRLEHAGQLTRALDRERRLAETGAHLADRLVADRRERPDLVGDDLRALLADLEDAADAQRLVRGDEGLVPPVRLRPHDHLDRTALVLEVEGRVAIALLVVLEAQRVNDATDLHLLAFL